MPNQNEYQSFLEDISSGVSNLKEKEDLKPAMASHLKYFYSVVKKHNMTEERAMREVDAFYASRP